jgi:hypothetical protein
MKVFNYFLLTILLALPLTTYADSLRFVVVTIDGQVVVVPAKEFLMMAIEWLAWAAAILAFGYFLRIVRYRVF